MHIELAEAALDRGNGSKALEHLAEVADADNPTLWAMRAHAWIYEDDAEKALDCTERGLQLSPEDPDLLQFYAAVQLELGELEKAERALLTVLNKNATHAPALYAYSLTLLAGGDTDGAHQMLNRLERSAGPSADSFDLRAKVHAAEGNEREAQRFIDLALEANPESAEANQTQHLLSAIKSDPAAADAGLRAAQLDPDAYAEQGRRSRYIKHPAMLPIRMVDRVGMVPLWMGSTFLLLLARRYLDPNTMLVVAVVYLTFVVYTWIAPPILRWWLRRTGRL